jgi:hypothetical protein
MNYPQLPAIRLDKERFSLQRAPMVGTIPLYGVAVALLTAAGCSTGGPSGSTTQSAAVQRDYERLTGTSQLTRGVVTGNLSLRVWREVQS